MMSAEKRKRTMSRIRSQSKLENRITKALWAEGYRFRKNVRTLMGSPDIAIQKYRVVIFIDSCFWHMCPTMATGRKAIRNSGTGSSGGTWSATGK
ncbi:hypothetical protein [Salinicoccus roseus]|uniref:hypothetical protein n=1 Tax=Salinicoccus roseus TaxID=45670 RepID=UPI00280BBC76|nr:hypothetical protein [Salinicoccus roseus]